MKLILVLDNIRSTYNVGAILRTAEGFGVSKVILSGYTPRVHDKNLLPHLREKLDKEIHKTALGAENLLDIYSSDDIISDLKELKNQGWKIIGLENNIEEPKLMRLNDRGLKGDLTDYSLYDIIDLFLEIPMKGKKESFNVSVAAGIAMYGIYN